MRFITIVLTSATAITAFSFIFTVAATSDKMAPAGTAPYSTVS